MPCAAEDEYCTGADGGRSFYFRINEVPVFMTGANMVPLDYYPKRMKSQEELEWLLLSSKAANIKALRIWGGGVYLDDNFYELADKEGVMIWHDLMFSCKVYPMRS